MPSLHVLTVDLHGKKMRGLERKLAEMLNITIHASISNFLI